MSNAQFLHGWVKREGERGSAIVPNLAKWREGRRHGSDWQGAEVAWSQPRWTEGGEGCGPAPTHCTGLRISVVETDTAPLLSTFPPLQKPSRPDLVHRPEAEHPCCRMMGGGMVRNYPCKLLLDVKLLLYSFCCVQTVIPEACTHLKESLCNHQTIGIICIESQAYFKHLC